jgi:hypothetical protein
MFKKMFEATQIRDLAMAMSVMLDPTSRSQVPGLLRVDQMR